MAAPLVRIPHDEFVARYWQPEPGQHFTMVGPNGCGKTTLGVKLVASAAAQHPGTRAVVLAMKPHKGPKEDGKRRTGDETVAKLTKSLGGKIVRTWPPPPAIGKKPAFYSFWPEHTFDLDVDEYRHWEAFRGVLNREYQKGNAWIFADEIYSLTEELKLRRELVRILTKGRSMKCAMGSATQRPVHVPPWAFSEAKHFFMWNARDRRAFERLDEIGNVDRGLVVRNLAALGKHECLYFCPDNDVMCVLT